MTVLFIVSWVCLTLNTTEPKSWPASSVGMPNQAATAKGKSIEVIGTYPHLSITPGTLLLLNSYFNYLLLCDYSGIWLGSFLLGLPVLIHMAVLSYKVDLEVGLSWDSWNGWTFFTPWSFIFKEAKLCHNGDSIIRGQTPNLKVPFKPLFLWYLLISYFCHVCWYLIGQR